jgi:uncharacterized Tic20 family protein
MPVTIVCPGCKAKLKAPDNLLGKTVKCPSCSKAVLVKAPAAAAPASVPAPTKKPQVKRAPVVEEDPTEDMEPTEDMGPLEDQLPDEEEEVEARPKKRKRSSSDSERSTASLIHLCTLINLILAPVGLLVPLFLWISKRKESAFVDHHFKTWLNFQISMFVVGLGVMFLFGGLAGVGFAMRWWWLGVIFIVFLVLITFALSVYMLIMYIVAGMKAKKGEWFEYRVLFRAFK